MKTRNRVTVRFRRPFALTGRDAVLAAGDYSVETQDELIEGVPYLAYRRLATLLRPHAQPGHAQSDHGHLTRAMAVDPDELDAALARDQVTAEAPASVTTPRPDEIDRRAVDRADDEGMIARPL